MSMADQVYRYTFNVLADLILYGNVVNSHCHTREECERTLSLVQAIVETMKKQVDRMEN